MSPSSTVSTFDSRVQILLFLVPAVALLINAAALFLNAYQIRRTNRQTRAGLVVSGLKDFLADTEIQEAFYLIEYSQFSYNETFHGSDLERRIDKLLRLFSNLALLWSAKILTTDDLQPLRYYVVRVYQDAEVRKYLSFMKSWTQRAGLIGHPYEAFERLAKTLERRTQGRAF